MRKIKEKQKKKELKKIKKVANKMQLQRKQVTPEREYMFVLHQINLEFMRYFELEDTEKYLGKFFNKAIENIRVSDKTKYAYAFFEYSNLNTYDKFKKVAGYAKGTLKRIEKELLEIDYAFFQERHHKKMLEMFNNKRRSENEQKMYSVSELDINVYIRISLAIEYLDKLSPGNIKKDDLRYFKTYITKVSNLLKWLETEFDIIENERDITSQRTKWLKTIKSLSEEEYEKDISYILYDYLPKLSYNEIHEEIKLMEWWKYERKRTIA